uniref:Uncharacterized protein n=1 Tax=Oryza brachyantha TaxID=4533 RepID=J3N886_ORYBR
MFSHVSLFAFRFDINKNKRKGAQAHYECPLRILIHDKVDLVSTYLTIYLIQKNYVNFFIVMGFITKSILIIS